MFNINFLNFSINSPRLMKKTPISSGESANFEKVSTINELEQWEQNEKNSIKKQPKWNEQKFPLSYFIEDEPIEGFNASIDKGFKNWSKVSQGLISFRPAFSEHSADIIVKWSDDKLTGRDFEAGRNDLKVVNNKIEKAYITIITNPKIDEGLTDEARLERVRRTALHEIGHALGLNHSNNSQDIMFHRGISNKNLSTSDISRLITHYNSKTLDITT